MQFRLPHSYFVAIVLFACFSGCNDGRLKVVPASGQVLMDGEPMIGAEGFVRVEPADGKAAFGKINPEDGTFSLTTYESNDGCLQGEHPVAVIVHVALPSRTISLIPEHYSDASTSNLTVSIDEATESLEIALTGGLKKAPKQSSQSLEGDDPGT